MLFRATACSLYINDRTFHALKIVDASAFSIHFDFSTLITISYRDICLLATFEVLDNFMRSTFSLFVGILMLNSLLVSQSSQSTLGRAGKLKGEARQTWHLQDLKSVKAYGVQSDKTIAELIGGMQPKKKIVVAVIDSGVDFEHEDLKGQLWINEGEIPNNGKDDDGNGFVDDVNGWNFLVDDDGEDIVYANLEATRVLRLSKSLQANGEAYPAWLTKEVLESAATIFNENTDNLNGYYQIVGV